MIRNFKILGLILTATLVVTALSASAASAAEFDSEETATVLKGSQEGKDVLSVTAGTVSCTDVTYGGLQLGTSSGTLILEPSYSGCTAFGFAGATINTNGCEYEFHAGGTVDIQGCNSASGIIVTAKLFGVTKCTVTIQPQNGIGGIIFTNIGSGTTREITIDFDIVDGIHYYEHPGTGIGACSTGTGTDGDYVGTARITGLSAGEVQHVGIWWTS